MKKILITFTILTMAVGITKAQVTKKAFNYKIALLGTAIDNKSLAGQNSAISSITGLMDAQINYLNSNNKTKGGSPAAKSDMDIEAYVKGLPTNIIITAKAVLINKLNQFAATCQ